MPAASLVLLVAGTLLVRGAPADYRRAWWNLLVWAGVALAISLPPRVELFGRALTTPMGWLASIGVPIVTVRDTRRLGIRLLLAASLATGLALDRILALAAGRLRRRWMWGARAAAAAVVCGASHDS